MPKPSGGARGIGLSETTWKLIEKIIDRHLIHGIQFHDALHGFHKQQGCGTANLECKLQQKEALMKGCTLFQVFVDITKAYDTMDREQLLPILEKI